MDWDDGRERVSALSPKRKKEKIAQRMKGDNRERWLSKQYR